ncbi:MAG: cytochrome C assembly protein, partial [Staphylococcus sp.]|nr:cytochrome C assembly protein [Staphylococcus sp.]
VILIAQWGIYAVGIAIFKDPKVMLSVIITLLYTVYIVMYLKKKIISINLIYFNIMIFCLCMVNLFFTTHFN